MSEQYTYQYAPTFGDTVQIKVKYAARGRRHNHNGGAYHYGVGAAHYPVPSCIVVEYRPERWPLPILTLLKF